MQSKRICLFHGLKAFNARLSKDRTHLVWDNLLLSDIRLVLFFGIDLHLRKLEDRRGRTPLRLLVSSIFSTKPFRSQELERKSNGGSQPTRFGSESSGPRSTWFLSKIDSSSDVPTHPIPRPTYLVKEEKRARIPNANRI